MSNAELLAILIRIGVKGSSAVDLGRELMRKFKTRDLVIAGRAMEIRVFDHLITGDGRYNVTYPSAKRSVEKLVRAGSRSR